MCSFANVPNWRIAVLRSLGVGRESDVLGLHRGVDGDAGQIVRFQGTAVVSDAQAFGQKNVQPLADALAPMAHAGTFMGQRVLEELLAGKVLEIGVVHPTVPDLLVGEPEGVLQHEHAEHEPHRLRRASLVGKTLRQLLVQPSPLDLVRQDDEFVLHVDDLIETGAEQIVMPRLLPLFRSHPMPPIQSLEGITQPPEFETKIARNPPPKPRNLANPATSNQPKRMANQWRPSFSRRTILSDTAGLGASTEPMSWDCASGCGTPSTKTMNTTHRNDTPSRKLFMATCHCLTLVLSASHYALTAV